MAKKIPKEDEADDVEVTSPLRTEKPDSDYKPADFSAGSFPTHAKVITKKDEQMVQAPPPPPVGYADGGIVQPDDQTQAINDYFTNQKQSVDQFGPDYQKAVADHLNQQQNGLGHGIAKAGAGFADALMQGVARAGNPGFLSGIQNQDQRNFENQTNLGKSLNEQNQAAIKEKMGMDQMNPASVLGAAKVHGAFTAMKSAFPQMADNDIQTFVSSPAFSELFPQLAGLRGKEIENQFKGQELDLGNRRLQSEDADRKLARELEDKRISAETANQQMQRQQKGEELKSSALKELGGMKWYNRVLHPGISEALKGQAGLSTPEETGPYGAETVRNGKTYEWSNLSKKYHLKQ